MAWLITWLIYGMAIALATRAALRLLPGTSAATRYVIWWAALVVIVLLPLVRAEAEAEGETSVASVAVATPPAVAIPSAATPPAAATDAPPVVALRTGPVSEPVVASSLPSLSLPALPDWLMAIAIGVWLGGVMLGLAQVLYSLSTMRSLRRTCRPLLAPREAEMPRWSTMRHRGRAVRVRASERVRTAAVLGLVRPIIAVPRSVSSSLTPDELDQVLLHEYAHVQRFDDWTRLLQVIVSAFIGWHPAVRLIMREIDFEREAACDDWVVDTTGAARAYARCLTKVVEITPSAAALPALTYATSAGGRLTHRIERLLDDRSRPASGRVAMLPALTGAVALAMIAFATVRAVPLVTDAVVIDGQATDGGDSARNADDSATASDMNPIAGAVAAARREPLQLARASMLPWPRLVDVLAASPVSVAPLVNRLAPAASAASARSTTAEAEAVAGTGVAAAAMADDATATQAAAAVSVDEPMLVARLDLPSESEPPPIASRPSYVHRESFGPMVAGGEAGLAVTADAGVIANPLGASAWGATGRGIGLGAKKAGTATASATTTAANSVKDSAVKTAKTLHRVTGSIFSKLR